MRNTNEWKQKGNKFLPGVANGAANANAKAHKNVTANNFILSF